MKNFETIMVEIKNLRVGIGIPKPKSPVDSKFDGWGERRGERAFIYTMPNSKNPKNPHKKGVTIGEIRQAYDQLISPSGFSRNWFKKYMPYCDKEGGCNFTTLGGIFKLIGVAEHVRPGLYQSR